MTAAIAHALMQGEELLAAVRFGAACATASVRSRLPATFDPAEAARKVRELAALKRAGLHILNTEAQFVAMSRYFQDPAEHWLVTQARVAHKQEMPCCALTMLQFQANGDVTVCVNRPPIGNIRVSPIRQLWKQRSQVWENGCCLAAGGNP